MNEEVPKAPAPEEETPAAPVGGEVPDWLRQLKPADVELEPPVALESSVAPGPVAVSFAAKVRAARGLVEGAAGETGLLPGKIAGDLGVADEMRRTDRKTDLSIEEIPEEELRKARGTLVKLRASDSHLKFLDDSIALQEQYRLGAEMAAAVEESMRAAVKELKPGWFEREPAMVREMAELQAFFNQSGDEANLREQIANLEEAKTNILWNFLNGTQKQTVESELLLAKNKLAALESVDRFMGREDMPRILRKVIDAARAGKEYSFGTGPVDNFRRRVYESVISTLGIETEPAVEVSPAIAPAAAPAPEPKPEPAAPVETAEQIRQRAEKEFLGEDELDPVVSQAQAKLRESILRGKSDPEAVALVLEKRVEQNPGASGAVVAGVKQLAMDVLEEARRERDPRKRQKMLTWVKDFGVGLEATAMVGSISLNALDALISAIVSELGGQK